MTEDELVVLGITAPELTEMLSGGRTLDAVYCKGTGSSQDNQKCFESDLRSLTRCPPFEPGSLNLWIHREQVLPEPLGFSADGRDWWACPVILNGAALGIIVRGMDEPSAFLEVYGFEQLRGRLEVDYGEGVIIQLLPGNLLR